MSVATTKSPEQIREEVKTAYTEKGCCGPSCGCGTEETGPHSTTGYTEEQITAGGSAAVLSLACGNPTAFADIRRGDVVLDLGCGAGFDLILAAERVGPDGRVYGVDMTDEMIDRARRNVAEAGATNVEVRKGLIEDLPIKSKSADWVISNCVVNLSPEKDRVFAEIARVLKPGGRFSISDIVAEPLPEAVLNDVAAYSACVAGAISEAEYVAGLERAGLVDLEVTDRVVYDARQLVEMVANDGAILESTSRAAGLVGEVEGKVWSARFAGRLATE